MAAWLEVATSTRAIDHSEAPLFGLNGFRVGLVTQTYENEGSRGAPVSDALAVMLRDTAEALGRRVRRPGRIHMCAWPTALAGPSRSMMASSVAEAGSWSAPGKLGRDERDNVLPYDLVLVPAPAEGSCAQAAHQKHTPGAGGCGTLPERVTAARVTLLAANSTAPPARPRAGTFHGVTGTAPSPAAPFPSGGRDHDEPPAPAASWCGCQRNRCEPRA